MSNFSPTLSFISRPKVTSIAQLTVPRPSSRRTSSALTRCWKRLSAYWRALPHADRPQFRFHHVSTDEVFGSLGADGRFTETTSYAPRSPYSASKAASDHLVRSWYHTYGLPVLITNCSNNYGPYHFPEKLIQLTIINGLEGVELPVYGNGGNVRDWLYVEDHARALVTVAMAGRAGETYAWAGRAKERI